MPALSLFYQWKSTQHAEIALCRPEANSKTGKQQKIQHGRFHWQNKRIMDLQNHFNTTPPYAGHVSLTRSRLCNVTFWCPWWWKKKENSLHGKVGLPVLYATRIVTWKCWLFWRDEKQSIRREPLSEQGNQNHPIRHKVGIKRPGPHWWAEGKRSVNFQPSLFLSYVVEHAWHVNHKVSLLRRRSYGFVRQWFLPKNSWGRNAWRTPKNVCVGGYHKVAWIVPSVGYT